MHHQLVGDAAGLCLHPDSQAETYGQCEDSFCASIHSSVFHAFELLLLRDGKLKSAL